MIPYKGTPHQHEVLQALGETELRLNQELVWKHMGEDGLVLQCVETRVFNLERQGEVSGQFQDWFMGEVIARLMLLTDSSYDEIQAERRREFDLDVCVPITNGMCVTITVSSNRTCPPCSPS